MARIISSLILVWALLLRSAVAHEVRHSTFPGGLVGTWAENAELCTAKDKSNILIEPANYGDASGSCKVYWVVETPGSQGTNYAAHAQCISASQPAKTQIVDIVIRPQGNDQAQMGRSFRDLKTYQRCSAQ
jgi:hypothetical protein